MYKLSALLCMGSLVVGCSYVPSLEQASGTSETNVLVGDVVQRVKCELADSFDDKIDDPNFRWLENWTAKVDLTLQVNAQSGVSPSGSYTNYYPNKFNFAAGSTSLTSTTAIASVQQTLTVAGGVNYSEQAQRAETVTFTVSLREIKDWKHRARAYIRRHYSAQDAEQFCKSSERELRGNLGLKEWIDSALYPVTQSQLRAGIHPQPGGGATKPPAATPKPQKIAAFPIQVPIAEARAEAKNAVTKADEASKTAIAAQAAIAASNSNVQTNMQLNIAPFFSVLTQELKRIISTDLSTLSTVQEYVKSDADNSANTLKEAQALEASVNALPGPTVNKDYVDDAKRLSGDVDKFKADAAKLQTTAKKVEDDLGNFKPNPPIDGLLHSAQFVLSYGANVTPSWSLLMWKGPGITPPGASASATRTHILNIALGAPSEQNRLIQNITVSNALAHP